MRNPLSKRIPRELKHNLFKYLGMIIILICTISIGSSFQATLLGTVSYLDKIKDGNLQEDGFLESSLKLSEEIISYLYNEGIMVSDNFYATENEFTDSSKILLFNERTKIDIPTVFEGRLPENSDEIAIDHVFSLNRNINIGDSITLLGKTYNITGTVSLPDYSSLFMNNTDLVMNTGHFCVSVLSAEGFNALSQDNITYRYSYRYINRELSEKDKNELAEKAYKYLLSQGVSIQNMLTREQNQSISFLEMDIGSDGPFMTVFVYLLVGLIAFIFAILTGNTIESESVIIGTLRASGYKKKEIVWHYLQPTFIVAILGSILGNLIGYTLMIKPFINIYYTTYSVGPIEIDFQPATFLITTILPIAIMVTINTLMLCSKLSLSPLRFLRKDLKKGKAKKAVKLPAFKFINRFRLRVILQNKGNYIMLFIGIFLASFLLMFGIGLNPLLENYTKEIDRSLPFEYQYILKVPVDTSEGEGLYVEEFKTWFSLGKKDISITCYGINENSEFFKEAYTKEGIKVSSALANKLNLHEGDELILKDKARDKEYNLSITGIYAYNAAMAVFADKNTLSQLLDEETAVNCIISNSKISINDKYVAKLISREDMLGAASQMMSSFDTVITFINIFSVVVYMIILYIMTKVVIEKNSLSISYMKVFGYNSSEIRKLYLSATTIVLVISLIICIPLEIWLFKLTLVYLSSMVDGYISFYLPNWVYIEIVVIGIVAYGVINTLHISSLKKIPMTDALKNRE